LGLNLVFGWVLGWDIFGAQALLGLTERTFSMDLRGGGSIQKFQDSHFESIFVNDEHDKETFKTIILNPHKPKYSTVLLMFDYFHY